MTDKIRQDAMNVNWSDSDSIITFYESNLLYYDNFNLISDEDSLIDIIKIKSHYISALISKNRHTKALKVLEQKDLLLDKIKHLDDLYSKQLERYNYYVGAANGYLKNYKVSANIFSDLCKCDPDNDMYRDWHEQMKLKLHSKQISYLGYLGVLIFLIAGYLYKTSYSHILILIGLIMVLIAGFFPYSNIIMRKLKIKK